MVDYSLPLANSPVTRVTRLGAGTASKLMVKGKSIHSSTTKNLSNVNYLQYSCILLFFQGDSKLYFPCLSSNNPIDNNFKVQPDGNDSPFFLS